ncbi:hypothetical protein COU57_01835 [Candidatus Pacearchaeota archaeon CG10_big_fil_rev_8_21_14_0_10_32_14]|nr:MAG: hypothetical protein COU57_01835 [Candidatus Pacearchaeota archaeon CG10_big_fil_rev_8_21_14_0_10_32_14]
MAIIEAQSNFNSLFYIVILSTIIVIGLIIFFIMKLRHNFKQVGKALGISAIITLIIEFFVWIYFSFINPGQVYCKMGANCPSSSFLSFLFVLYFFVPILLIVLFIYYLIVFIRNKNKK